LAKALLRFHLPRPVLENRFAAPLFDFILGMLNLLLYFFVTVHNLHHEDHKETLLLSGSHLSETEPNTFNAFKNSLSPLSDSLRVLRGK
jgi:hypothetical protein